MIEAGEHIAIFGLTGSGKSTLTREISRLSVFDRKVIFDRLGEWGADESTHVVTTFTEFKQAYENAHPSERFTILIRPRAGTPPEALLDLVDQVLQLVYRVETFERKGLGVFFEEVWLYAPLFQTPPWFIETILTGRHQRISIIGNAQRPATVSKSLVSQARHVFIGQFFESRDRKYYADCFGDVPELSRPPGKFQFYWFRQGHEITLISIGKPSG